MNRLIYFIISILVDFVILAGCSMFRNLSTPTVAPTTVISMTPMEIPTYTLKPVVPTLAPTSVPPTFTLTPSPVVPTVTPGTAMPPENIMTYKPVEIIPSLPASVRPSGSLVLEGPESFILHFEETLHLESLEESDCLSTSPDGQWLAYCNGRRLYIESADRQQHNTIWLEYNLIEFGAHLWVNNQQMVFSSLKEYNEAYPVVVVNPFTGRHVQSPTDFPGFKGGICGPSQGVRYQFNYAPLVYDPSLTLIVYPDMSNPAYIVLWDIQAEKALAKIEEGICFGNYPLWSPDGLRFVVANYLKDSNQTTGEAIEEWASVSREGQVEWLTHFADYFEEVEVMEANWSPDGRQVAFWLQTRPDPCANDAQAQDLSVLDVDTHQVVNYCVSGAGDPPVWSLDGRYIAIRKFDADGISQILLVDLEQGWAATIAGTDIWPVGWLKAP
jgi:hypothetical protein